MKMTKQVVKMVEYINDYLEINHIKDVADEKFMIMIQLLVQGDCYGGFNYFTVDNKLSGGPNEHFDHLRFYIR